MNRRCADGAGAVVSPPPPARPASSSSVVLVRRIGRVRLTALKEPDEWEST
jgi:hypothetical protein